MAAKLSPINGFHPVFQEAICLFLIISSPLVCLLYWIAYEYYEASLSDTVLAIRSAKDIIGFVVDRIPRPTLASSLAYLGWVVYQAALYQYAPGPLHIAPRTPGGRRLSYRLNGLTAWALTLFTALAASKIFNIELSWIAKHWGQLLASANLYCAVLIAIFRYKSKTWPDNHGETISMDGFWRDLMNGGELHPRTGELFDWKHFNASRTGGILLWTLMSNWFLETLDGSHERFSFYSIYGFAGMMPHLWTLQSQYLAIHPVSLSKAKVVMTVIFFVIGWAGRHFVDQQKSVVKATNGYCTIWWNKPRIIRTKYTTSDGKSHEVVILGFWGIARHLNYVGSVIYTWASCFACGTDSFFPYAEAVVMTLMCIHRCHRDEARCQEKYGKAWDEYCREVPWRMVPGLY
ncbi:hypothetical protein COCC4DRAFT_151050 [Bipolaris maydis ATCC 48331]|uniref:7-dehydrocholesterol reductase n=2 Tax=Cochliobolus heterostrophus TaxID=5016 RepID=M2UHL7_COCH5|nr:uncharacterized protein COCC4DRAFT_151050 [Bipolaris maydis ATCC 48331]EMD93181.1 hypothetical protein COCHEDRAFT_1097250 [Bipolaris maydis C5]KAJ5025783.1 ergosterol biosynthesis ERG4/ERG24 family-domain-containing protein [Bipolaris maydis]ENI00226.1 hypothetical protein COCC4DRAFT_151050 [Bipolaris maydis ATCC 48331]KAJ6195911.1 7-dehydrocholesterol reductase [Bipolaris maydis]KAJ6207995.1 7-dehydrocholesterol reductase [Bipolaris maydis]